VVDFSTKKGNISSKMPTYEYGCESCGYVEDIFHSFSEKPSVKCPTCGRDCRKLVTSFYLGGANSPSVSEMKRDLKENHGIDQIRLLDGTFKDFYHGVKKDSGRVQEELKQHQEAYIPKKAKRLTEKEADNRVKILKQKKAEKEYNKRKVTI